MITPGSALISCSSLQEGRQKPTVKSGTVCRHDVDSHSLINQADSASPTYLGNLKGRVYLVQPGCHLPHPKAKSPQGDRSRESSATLSLCPPGAVPSLTSDKFNVKPQHLGLL